MERGGWQHVSVTQCRSVQRVSAWQPVRHVWDGHQHVHLTRALAWDSLALLKVPGQCQAGIACRVQLPGCTAWLAAWCKDTYLVPEPAPLPWALPAVAVISGCGGFAMAFCMSGTPKCPNHYESNCFQNLGLHVRILAQIWIYIPDSANYYFFT